MRAIWAAFLIVGTAAAATGDTPAYNPQDAFATFTMPTPPSATRGANGLPTAAYWQNRADYDIHVTLDPNAKTLSGDETIAYANNSPDTLDVLWLQLDQNIYRIDGRGMLAGGRGDKGSTDGYAIASVEVAAVEGDFQPVSFIVDDTRMQIRLPQALASGKKMKLRIKFGFHIPGEFGGRMGWGKAKDGEIYDMAQWYPRMAVYDDVRGWDPLPYLGQEFYLEYGDIDYYVTVPSEMLVAGSGALQNPAEVLTATEQQRLAQAAGSDRTVMIRSPGEIADPSTRPAPGGSLTWHFRMENTRDVAFSASAVFAWDAARINLPGGKAALAMSFYPAESAGPDRWDRSTEFEKDAIERYSQRWYPYPWPAMINVAGPASGMEYPGMLFDGIDDKGKQLFYITAHEAGHTLFPMIVGFDERRDAWMDEGFNTFIDVYESDDFNRGEFAPKRDSEYAPKGGNPVDEILPVLADPEAPPIVSRADTVIEKYRHPVTYFKTALGLILLREQIIGPQRFDPAFRAFIAAWAFKHPKPSDFFRAMENETGEDLGWFWRGWFLNNWQMDLAVSKIAYKDGDPEKGASITVESRDRLVMPVTLRLGFADGTSQDVSLPAETWIRQQAVAVFVPTTRKIVTAVLDPDHKLPDRDRGNNAMAGP